MRKLWQRWEGSREIPILPSELRVLVGRTDPPDIRGFHWWLTIRHKKSGDEPFELPPDEAPYGSMPPPLLPKNQEPES